MEIERKAYWALKTYNFELPELRTNWFIQLNTLEELTNESYANLLNYKNKTKKWNDARLRGNKNFQPGQKVLVFNSRLKLFPRKLRNWWYGPYVIKDVYPHGASELSTKEGWKFKVNGNQVKHYEAGIPDEDIKEEEVNFDTSTTRVDLGTFFPSMQDLMLWFVY